MTRNEGSVDDFRIKDNGDLRKYRTELPNLIDDLKLSVWAFRLYVHLKRVAGDEGACWQSTATLAESCLMSEGTVSNAKVELVEKRLISIESHQLERGGRAAHLITINDIWLENFLKYSGRTSCDEQPSSLHEVASSPHEQPSSPHEIKKEPLVKKQPIKNQGRDQSRASEKSKERDPLLDNPAIMEYRKLARRHIPAIYRSEVAGIVTDLALWSKIVREWIGNGWNAGNINGLLNAYQAGGIQGRNGGQPAWGGKGTYRPKPKEKVPTFEEFDLTHKELYGEPATQADYQEFLRKSGVRA